MFKLEQDNQIVISHENIAEILKAYSMSEFTFTYIDKGIVNTSLIIESAGNKYVLRIYAQEGKSNEDIAFELQFQDYLRAEGIPIPYIHLNTSGNELTVTQINGKEWQTILMDFVEGSSVTENPSRELISELATLQAKMHILGIEFVETTDRARIPWKDLHDSLVLRIKSVPENRKDILDFVERVKKYSFPLTLELPYGYNHLDLDLDGNILTKANRVSGIIDFEDLEYSPTIACLGFSLWNILDDEGEEAMFYYLSEYEKVRSLETNEREMLRHVIFFRNYVIGMTRLLLWDENTPIEDIDNIIKHETEIPNLHF
jgi:Ser/Thr protein kinase RdoA (MazF antagonist)